MKHDIFQEMVGMTLLPKTFLPAIGNLMVAHAFLDSSLQKAIFAMSNVDFSIGISLLSDAMTSRKSDIFKNLARVTEHKLESLCKMLVLADLVDELSTKRNVFAHHLPDWANADGTEIGYFKDVNKTSSQIRVLPPVVATKQSILTLATELENVGLWLNMFIPSTMPMGTDIAGKTVEQIVALQVRHPRWDDDAQFPWQDKLRDKLKRENHKPQNNHRKLKP